MKKSTLLLVTLLLNNNLFCEKTNNQPEFIQKNTPNQTNAIPIQSTIQNNYLNQNQISDLINETSNTNNIQINHVRAK